MNKIHLKALTLLMALLVVLGSFNVIKAQEVRRPMKINTLERENFEIRYGMGLSTRYMWRGLDLAKSPTLEPYASILFHGFELSAYGVYGLYESAPKHPDFNEPENPGEINPVFLETIAFGEIISNLFYSFQANIGTISIGATDYYFPDRLVRQTETDTNGVKHIKYIKSRWGNWEGGGNGAHIIEAIVRYQGNSSFPAWLLIGYNIYNDPDNSLFTEAGYTFNILNNNFSLFAGGAIGGSAWYQFTIKNGVVQDGMGLTNFGFILNRELILNEGLSLDFSLMDVVNFYQERNTILFKVILRIQ
ncbi:hypothetical protein BMS3Abin03_01980 [bacterium BMS3Abin03]|nr:hypothetical protein BMS3Abin03_01980 [bacterium BMS3Abin03]